MLNTAEQSFAPERESSWASVEIMGADARRYLHRLCKHFSHKVHADWSENQGYVEFAMGSCRMTAGAEALSFQCEAANQSDLQEIVDTIDRHFVRFAEKHKLSLSWTSN